MKHFDFPVTSSRSSMVFLLTAAALVVVGCSSKQPVPANSETATNAADTHQAHAESGGSHEEVEAKHEAKAKGREPLRTQEDGAELYGAEFTPDQDLIELRTIVASAKDYDGKVVRTQGMITAVCKKMGCWIEITSEGAGDVRVPMAGHAYFLPETAQGRMATVEGKIEVEPLSEDMKKHLAEEGAKATENEVSLSATTVLVHPAAVKPAAAGQAPTVIPPKGK